jgi:hypothetical protein
MEVALPLSDHLLGGRLAVLSHEGACGVPAWPRCCCLLQLSHTVPHARDGLQLRLRHLVGRQQAGHVAGIDV